MILSRNWSLFLVAAGAFNWLIWPRFAVAIWEDQRAWSGAVGQSMPTAFLLVHAVLIVTAVTIGTIIAILGVRGFLAARRAGRITRTEPLSVAERSRSTVGEGGERRLAGGRSGRMSRRYFAPKEEHAGDRQPVRSGRPGGSG